MSRPDGPSLRIALLPPAAGDPARRGAEPLAGALASSLQDRGHDVTVIEPTVLGRASERVETTIEAVLSLRGFTGPLVPAARAGAALLRGRYDLVHAFSVPGAFVARAWRSRFGGPIVFTCAEEISRATLADRRLRLKLLTGATDGSNLIIVPSEEQRAALERWLATDALVVRGDDGEAHAQIYRRLVADTEGRRART